jgi:hypothetical protein
VNHWQAGQVGEEEEEEEEEEVESRLTLNGQTALPCP